MIRFVKEIQGTRDSDNYATPKKFYEKIHTEFAFDFDPCPLRSEIDGLCIDWIGNIYVNPPYSNIEPFIIKGINELRKGNATKIVYLIPVRSDTKYWHTLIMEYASELRFIKGRLNFNDSKSPAPFPVVLVIFDRSLGGDGLKTNSYFQ
jgi:site-specific DNA-methyltransferase (adenine-specific)